jgi:hypothetical protein
VRSPTFSTGRERPPVCVVGPGSASTRTWCNPRVRVGLVTIALASTALAQQQPLPCPLQPAASPFAATVWSFEPAPGQFVNSTPFSDPCKALGAPVGGGTLSPDNSKIVSLGGFSGRITLGFNHPVVNDPRNRFGVDAIVFGNAHYVGGNPNRRWAEPGAIEISRDVNRNGVPDDPWYLIAGSHFVTAPAPVSCQTWDDDIANPAFPPGNPLWIPPGRHGQWTTCGFRLPSDPFEQGPVLLNPNGPFATREGVWGYADCTPTLALGDVDGDNIPDDETITPEEFYTLPDDPLEAGVTTWLDGGGGGGDAVAIDWAVDPVTLEPPDPPLDAFDFIRITTAVVFVNPQLGEMSTEIGGVADARPPLLADWNGDGIVNSTDVSMYINDWFEAQLTGSIVPDVDGNGVVNSTDVSTLINFYFEESAP